MERAHRIPGRVNTAFILLRMVIISFCAAIVGKPVGLIIPVK
jgi:hypothetical protein